MNLLLNGNIIGRAEQSREMQAKATKEEERILSNSVEFMNAVVNKKPNIEILKDSDRTESTMKITTKATDGNGEKLTYKLYLGTSKDNLVEQIEIKENVEQGVEVFWIVPVSDKTSVYYYKIIVSDKYAEIDSEIKSTNSAPILGEIKLEKDIDEETGKNWIKITTSATDEENDKLNFTLKIWKKEEGANEEDLIKQEPTRTETKKNVTVGENIEIIMAYLEEYQDYIYRIDVADENNETIGTKKNVKTYCSGQGFECEGGTKCRSVSRGRQTLYLCCGYSH